MSSPAQQLRNAYIAFYGHFMQFCAILVSLLVLSFEWNTTINILIVFFSVFFVPFHSFIIGFANNS